MRSVAYHVGGGGGGAKSADAMPLQDLNFFTLPVGTRQKRKTFRILLPGRPVKYRLQIKWYYVLYSLTKSHFYLILFLQDDCRQIEFREQTENKALSNHVIISHHVVNEEMCRINCYLEPNCVSYNYGPENDGLFLCELNDMCHLQALSNELKDKDGFLYSPIYKVDRTLNQWQCNTLRNEHHCVP